MMMMMMNLKGRCYMAGQGKAGSELLQRSLSKRTVTMRNGRTSIVDTAKNFLVA
jgi:hypothetical protein